MNEHDQTQQYSADSFQTGSARPPKKHRALVSILLVAVILLVGLSSTLGFLNFRLFQKMSHHDTSDATIGFSEQEQQDDSPSVNTPVTGDANLTLDLQPSPESVENIPQDGGLSLQQIYEKAIVSVVSISCSTTSGSSSGTGVVLSADGYLLTNAHVIEGATAIEVLCSDGRTMSAAIVGADTISDLAVLHVDASDLSAAEFGNSDALRVGDVVVAIGDPLGVELRGTMTNGIVSAINRDLNTDGRTMTLIQTNAALNSGNSGGPLLNCYGQVIGINTMKIGDSMSSAGVEGLGFAIPSATVKQIVDQLLKQGYVSGRPNLGIAGITLSTRELMLSRLPQGFYITEVDPDSSAAENGIKAGDVLLYLDKTRITGSESLQTALYSYEPGDSVSVVIYRNGRQYYVTLRVQENK